MLRVAFFCRAWAGLRRRAHHSSRFPSRVPCLGRAAALRTKTNWNWWQRRAGCGGCRIARRLCCHGWTATRYGDGVNHGLHSRCKKGCSVAAWVALECFPVQTASIFEWQAADKGSLQLSIDRLGYASVTLHHDGMEVKASSSDRLRPGRWLHVTATLKPRGLLTLYVDGETQGSAACPPSSRSGELAGGVMMLGRASKCDVTAEVFPTGVLNGLIREVRLYDRTLEDIEVVESAREFTVKQPVLPPNAIWFPDDDQRPTYHPMPPRAWTNEPHGLVFFRGEYHLFYQKNANGPFWGHIHWGHMTSPNLMDWTERPIALAPEPGPDAEGCWSGSALVVDHTLYLIYTGGDGKRASICVASSEDGVHFVKHAGNPVIEAPPPDLGLKEFRDPFVWREGSEYRLIIGSGVEGVGGTALLYKSKDLTSWKFIGKLFAGSKETSGVFWEMPVFVPIGSHHVLIVCEVPGRASYWVGQWSKDEFHVLSPEPRRLDLIDHFLSPTPYIDKDSSVLAVGIVPDTRNSREAWQAGWAHLYGVPRQLTLDAQMNLQQRPLGALSARFSPLLRSSAPIKLGESWHELAAAGSCLSLELEVVKGKSDAIVIGLRRSPNDQEVTLLRYEWKTQQVALDRTRSSLNSHVSKNLQTAGYAPREAETLRFHIMLDHSVLEVFLDDRACFSTRIYPVLPESIGVAARAEGGTAVLGRISVGTFTAQI